MEAGRSPMRQRDVDCVSWHTGEVTRTHKDEIKQRAQAAGEWERGYPQITPFD